MKTRNASIIDIPSIQAIAHAAWRPTYGHILTEEQCVYMLNKMYDGNTLREQMEGSVHFFMAENEASEPLGFASFEKTGEQVGKLHKLYTNPLIKEKGTGTVLIETIKSLALDLNVHQIELNVNRFNNAVEFYLKKGFKIDYEMDLDIGNGFYMNDYVMSITF